MVAGYFQFKQRQTNLRTEVIAGVTTFLTMAYIIFVNPNILSDGTGMNKEALIAVTCIATALATILVGFVANAPIAMAPGMGLNAFFAYTLVLGNQIKWETALGVVFLSGLFFLILTLVGLRRKLVEAIPSSLISAIAVGIGLFITFIGLVNLGVVVDNPATLVSAGPLNATVLIGLVGLLVMLILEMKKVKGALLIGIIFSTAVGAAFGEVQKPADWLRFHLDISAVAFHLDIAGALKWSLFGSIFSLMFMDMFDSIGTLVGCCHQARLVDERGRIKGLDRLLGIDAAATIDRSGAGNIDDYLLYRVGRRYRTGWQDGGNGNRNRRTVPSGAILCAGDRNRAPIRNRTGTDYGRAFYDEGSQEDKLRQSRRSLPRVYHNSDDCVKLQYKHRPCVRLYRLCAHPDGGGQSKAGQADYVGHSCPFGSLSVSINFRRFD